MAQTELMELVARIKADASEMEKGLKGAEGQAKKSSQNIGKALGQIGIAMAAVGTAIVGGFGMAAKSAMEAVESENLFAVSLGNAADKAREWSKALSDALGLNEYELRRNIGVLYVMTSSMGVNEDAAYDLAKGITELAYDMASFYNLPTEEAFNKLRAGLTGETEPLKRIGILVDEATIKTAAYTHGLVEAGEELTQTQKVQARYLAIMDQTVAAQGDLARTMDSPMNKLRVLGSRFDELKISIGEGILPLVSKLMDFIGNITKGIGNWIDKNRGLVNILSPLIVSLGALSLVGGVILIALPKIIGFVGLLKTQIALTIPIVGGLTVSVAALAAAISMATLGIGLLIVGIMGLINNAKKRREAIEKVSESQQSLNQIQKDAATALKDYTKEQREGEKATKDTTEAIIDEISALQSLHQNLRAIGDMFPEGIPEAVMASMAKYLPGYETALRKHEMARYAAGLAFQHGGIVPGPIGQPQLAMVHGGEKIIPAGGTTGDVVINFTQPVFMENEAMMGNFARQIYKHIERNQRIRFGGAYSGG